MDGWMDGQRGMDEYYLGGKNGPWGHLQTVSWKCFLDEEIVKLWDLGKIPNLSEPQKEYKQT